MKFKKWSTSIQTAGYNGARTVCKSFEKDGWLFASHSFPNSKYTIIHLFHLSGINDEQIENHHGKEKLSTEDLIFRAVRSLLDTAIDKSLNSENRQLGPVGGGDISSFFSFISYLILLITLIGGPGGITLGILWVLGFWSNMKWRGSKLSS